jgi:hypothetical protein
MKKEEKINMFSRSKKYYIIAFFLVLIIFMMYYFFFNFKTGDLVYKKNFNTLGEIVGISPLKLGYLVYWQNETYTTEFAFNLERVDQIREGTFDQIGVKNETLRYVPPTLPEDVNFSKTLFNELLRESIDNADSIYGQIPAITKIENCTPNLKCGAWSDCQVNYNLESLVNLDKIEGLQYKSCIDLNKCIPDIMGLRECVSRVNITLTTGFWCEKEYTEVKDKNGKVLARLNTNNQSNYLDVNINLGEEDYCFYCYDEKMDYDETGLDCGGSCKPCSEVEQKV